MVTWSRAGSSTRAWFTRNLADQGTTAPRQTGCKHSRRPGTDVAGRIASGLALSPLARLRSVWGRSPDLQPGPPTRLFQPIIQSSTPRLPGGADHQVRARVTRPGSSPQSTDQLARAHLPLTSAETFKFRTIPPRSVIESAIMAMTRREALGSLTALSYSRVLGANDRTPSRLYRLRFNRRAARLRLQPPDRRRPRRRRRNLRPRLDQALAVCNARSGGSTKGYRDFRKLLDNKHIEAIVV